MEKQQFVCAKCGYTHYTTDKFQATGANILDFLIGG